MFWVGIWKVEERKNWIILEVVEIEKDLSCFAICLVYFDLTSAIWPLGGKGEKLELLSFTIFCHLEVMRDWVE